MDNNQQYSSQMIPPQQPQKIIMVTPYSVADDNNNPTANKLILAAVICMCISKFAPAISMVFMTAERYIDMPYIPTSFNILMFIVSIVLVIIARVQYPGNSMAKGLLIGLIANVVISILTAVGALAILFGILSAYSPAVFSDFIYELMEIWGF